MIYRINTFFRVEILDDQNSVQSVLSVCLSISLPPRRRNSSLFFSVMDLRKRGGRYWIYRSSLRFPRNDSPITVMLFFFFGTLKDLKRKKYSIRYEKEANIFHAKTSLCRSICNTNNRTPIILLERNVDS